jgi:hypothetical protein
MNIVCRQSPLWLLVVTTAMGCGGVRQPLSTTPPPSVTQRLNFADVLARDGRYAEAQAAYAAILASGSGGDRALLAMTRVALDPTNPDRDDRHAVMYLARLIAEYPRSAVMAEALTWRSLLDSVERLQRDVRRYQQDVERLSRDLRREQQETARLRDERERLRQIDIEYERPKPVLGAPTYPEFPLKTRE